MVGFYENLKNKPSQKLRRAANECLRELPSYAFISAKFKINEWLRPRVVTGTARGRVFWKLVYAIMMRAESFSIRGLSDKPKVVELGSQAAAYIIVE